MGEQDVGKESDKDIGKSKDGSDKTTDRLRDVSRDVSSMAQTGNYESLKDAAVKQFGPMGGGGWMSLKDEEAFNAKTQAIAAGTPQQIQDVIKQNVTGAKVVQALIPAIDKKLSQIIKTKDTEKDV